MCSHFYDVIHYMIDLIFLRAMLSLDRWKSVTIILKGEVFANEADCRRIERVRFCTSTRH